MNKNKVWCFDVFENGKRNHNLHVLRNSLYPFSVNENSASSELQGNCKHHNHNLLSFIFSSHVFKALLQPAFIPTSTFSTATKFLMIIVHHHVAAAISRYFSVFFFFRLFSFQNSTSCWKIMTALPSLLGHNDLLYSHRDYNFITYFLWWLWEIQPSGDNNCLLQSPPPPLTSPA